MKEKKDKIQICKKFGAVDTEYTIKKLLEKQNKIRQKYGLRPLKRLNVTTFLYCLKDDRQEQKPQPPEYKEYEYRGVYQ